MSPIARRTPAQTLHTCPPRHQQTTPPTPSIKPNQRPKRSHRPPLPATRESLIPNSRAESRYLASHRPNRAWKPPPEGCETGRDSTRANPSRMSEPKGAQRASTPHESTTRYHGVQSNSLYESFSAPTHSLRIFLRAHSSPTLESATNKLKGRAPNRPDLPPRVIPSHPIHIQPHLASRPSAPSISLPSIR